MKRMQKIGYMAAGAALALTLGATIPVVAASVQKQIIAYYSGIKVFVDGEQITPKDGLGNIIEPFVVDGTVYLPAHSVAGALGKTSEWDSTTQSFYIGNKPGTVQYMTDVLPAYQNSNTHKYKEYSAIKSGGTESFSMAGEKYVNGFTISDYTNWAVWNLNGQYTNFTGTFGHVDGSSIDVDVEDEFRVLYIYCDGILKQEIPFRSDMNPKGISINTTGVNQLKLLLGAQSHAGVSPTYGFGNATLK